MKDSRKQKIEAQIEMLKAQVKSASADARLDLERRIDDLQKLL